VEAEEAEKQLRDYLLNGIVTEIFWAEEAYALAEEVSKHAQAIHAAGFTSLFGSLQVLLSDRQTLSVTKMFDQPKRYPTRSIPAILEFLKAHAGLWKVPERRVLHPTLIEAGAERQSLERLTNVELTHEIVSHYESRLTSLSPSLTELRQSRDKVIAHNEAIERSTLQPPTWGAAISLVEYAKDFVATISFGYLSTNLRRVGGDYSLSDNARRTSKQLRRLLDAADISG
jgi:hypothetical protein